MTKGRRIGASVIAAVVVLALLAQPVPAATITVEMRDNVFVPRDVTIAVGDTIVWPNVGVFPHTATEPNGLFNSGIIQPGGRYEFTFTNVTPGTYLYYCVLHGTPTGQGMAGTITVQGTGGTTTSIPGTTTTSQPTTTTTRPPTTTTQPPTTTTSTTQPTTTTTRPTTTTTPPATTTTSQPTTTTTRPPTTTTQPPTATTTTQPLTTTTRPPTMTTTTVGAPTTTRPPSGGSACDRLRRDRAAFNARIDREEQTAIARLEGAEEARALARLAETRRVGNASFDRRLAQCERPSGRTGLGSFVSGRAVLT